MTEPNGITVILDTSYTWYKGHMITKICVGLLQSLGQIGIRNPFNGTLQLINVTFFTTGLK
jgi:hypothetical protein